MTGVSCCRTFPPAVRCLNASHDEWFLGFGTGDEREGGGRGVFLRLRAFSLLQIGELLAEFFQFGDFVIIIILEVIKFIFEKSFLGIDATNVDLRMGILATPGEGRAKKDGQECRTEAAVGPRQGARARRPRMRHT